jgi:hypothetical protein
MIRAGSSVPGPRRRTNARAATRATTTAAESPSGSSRCCPASGARSAARTSAPSRTVPDPMLRGAETARGDSVGRGRLSRSARADCDVATSFGPATGVSPATRGWAADPVAVSGSVTATGSTIRGVRPASTAFALTTASRLGPASNGARGSADAPTSASRAGAIATRGSTAGAASTGVSTLGAGADTGSVGPTCGAAATGATGTSAGVAASAGPDAGCGSGTAAGGAGTGCDTSAGSKPSGSTYPSGSAAIRTPR